jgi:hypothetical protein
MPHSAAHAWVDFVRGVSGPEISRNIKAHFAEGCAECKAANYTWSRVRRFTQEESAYAPPENVVRLAKLNFSGKTEHQSKTWTMAGLVFNSFTQPLQAGVRSSGALNVWQVIYEAEGLTVDLRFGRRAQSKEVHVVGQVFDKREVRALQNHACVELSTEQEQLIATADVSALGEFHIEFEAKDDLWLSVKAEDRKAVRIPLTNPR